MTFTVQKLPNVPAILLSLTHDYDLSTDFPKSHTQIRQMLDSADQPVYYITDLTEAAIDVEFLIQGAGKTSLGSQGNYHHPMVKEVLLVSPQQTIHYVAESLRQDTYGNVPARAFNSMDEALAYVRANG